MFDNASDDISNEGVVLIIEVEVIDVVNKLLLSVSGVTDTIPVEVESV
jgi:hypothetical protein